MLKSHDAHDVQTFSGGTYDVQQFCISLYRVNFGFLFGGKIRGCDRRRIPITLSTSPLGARAVHRF